MPVDAYQVAINWNNTGGLATLNPQPRGLGVSAPVDYGLDGSATQSGPESTALEWDVATRAEYNAIMTAFGFTSTVRAKQVTVRIRLNDDTFANRNAWAYAPSLEREAFFWKRLRIILTRLRTAS